MTLPQAFAFAILLGMMALFIWGRLRYDLVALLALSASIVTGIVPYKEAFSGFSDDIIIIIASALLLSAAVARSGVVETVLRFVGPHLTTTSRQVVALSGAVAVISAFVKNIGALAMLMPVAFQVARRTGTSPSSLLMPMAFGSLIGGIVTLVGTSPNVIVSRVREEIVGEPFRMFDFTPVGAGIAIAGLIFLGFGWRLLPQGRKGAASLDAAFNIAGYTVEALLPADSPYIGKTVGELEALGEGDVTVGTIIRERFRRYTPTVRWTLQENDTLLLHGEAAAIDRVVGQAKLSLPDDAAAEKPGTDERIVMEAVVTGDSILLEESPAQLRLRERFGVAILAVSRSGERISRRIRSMTMQPGDLVLLQGYAARLPEAMGELRCLPLAEREMRLGQSRRGYLPLVILLVAVGLVAVGLVPIAIAFFGASVSLLLFRVVSVREAYEIVEWPILVLIGALIPVSEAVRTTGATDLIAAWLSLATQQMPAIGALAVVLVAAMAVTPFLNNAATVLVMAPIAASFASKLGLNPDPFLMAVAIGAACDFLTPIGHQSNTLVMGPGGYRFGDYWRLGLPLSGIVIVIGVPLIALFWPLTQR